ncbi:MAG TPA: GAP family protein [Solirubrobacterales bacterium]
MGDLIGIFGFALLAMLNPTLLAAVTVMMLLPNTKRLMLGYLLGAYTTSITVGLLIVFSLHDTDSVETAQHSLAPGQDVVLGLLLLAVAYALGGGRTEGLRERRRERKEAKQEDKGPSESWPERMLGRGDARVTYAVGVLLTFPGVAYLTALDRIAKLDEGATVTVLLVLSVALIQQALLEIPLLGYAIAPERTQRGVTEFRDWLSRRGRDVATVGAALLGSLLILRGLIGILG